MIESLPYSQMLRAKRIIGEGQDAEEALDRMASDFRRRGYPLKLIEDQRLKVTDKERSELLHGKKMSKTLECIPFVSTYNNLSPNIGNILRRHWSIVRNSFSTIKEFQVAPLMS